PTLKLLYPWALCDPAAVQHSADFGQLLRPEDWARDLVFHRCGSQLAEPPSPSDTLCDRCQPRNHVSGDAEKFGSHAFCPLGPARVLRFSSITITQRIDAPFQLF